jgi:hypothetical protein
MPTMAILTDVRDWARGRSGLDGDALKAVVEAIDHDTDHPAWGADWSEYLERVDLWGTVDAKKVILMAQSMGGRQPVHGRVPATGRVPVTGRVLATGRREVQGDGKPKP